MKYSGEFIVILKVPLGLIVLKPWDEFVNKDELNLILVLTIQSAIK